MEILTYNKNDHQEAEETECDKKKLIYKINRIATLREAPNEHQKGTNYLRFSQTQPS